MDNVHCNIIQDLLPLYADDVVSVESRQMVDWHLEDCETCREVLAEIRGSIPVPQQTDTRVLTKMRRKERLVLLIPILGLILMLYIVIGEPVLAHWLDSKMDYGPQDCIVTTSDEGRPVIEMSERAKGANIYYLYDRNEKGMVDVYICIDGNPGQFAPIHKFLGRILKWDFSGDSIYVTPTLGLNPPHAQMSNYPGTMALLLDETVSSVYYQPISYDEKVTFLNQYLWKISTLGEDHLMGYEVPESDARVLLWSAE